MTSVPSPKPEGIPHTRTSFSHTKQTPPITIPGKAQAFGRSFSAGVEHSPKVRRSFSAAVPPPSDPADLGGSSAEDSPKSELSAGWLSGAPGIITEHFEDRHPIPASVYSPRALMLAETDPIAAAKALMGFQDDAAQETYPTRPNSLSKRQTPASLPSGLVATRSVSMDSLFCQQGSVTPQSVPAVISRPPSPSEQPLPRHNRSLRALLSVPLRSKIDVPSPPMDALSTQLSLNPGRRKSLPPSLFSQKTYLPSTEPNSAPLLLANTAPLFKKSTIGHDFGSSGESPAALEKSPLGDLLTPNSLVNEKSPQSPGNPVSPLTLKHIVVVEPPELDITSPQKASPQTEEVGQAAAVSPSGLQAVVIERFNGPLPGVPMPPSRRPSDLDLPTAAKTSPQPEKAGQSAAANPAGLEVSIPDGESEDGNPNTDSSEPLKDLGSPSSGLIVMVDAVDARLGVLSSPFPNRAPATSRFTGHPSQPKTCGEWFKDAVSSVAKRLRCCECLTPKKKS